MNKVNLWFDRIKTDAKQDFDNKQIKTITTTRFKLIGLSAEFWLASVKSSKKDSVRRPRKYAL